jgi:tetratricopeptide (TPR) repeat protein
MMIRPHAVSILSLLGLAACASAPPERPSSQGPGGGIVLQPALYQSFEEAHRDKALSAQQQHRWAEAAAEWEILALLVPQRTEYQTQQREARSRIAKGVEENLSSAEEARQRGDVAAASRCYLKVLSLDPSNSTAIEALRRLEQDVYRRSLHTRVAHQPKDGGAPRSGPALERRDLEFGVLLLRQGDYPGSIKTLEKYLKSSPKDDLARRYLADAHFQLAQQRLEEGRKEDALTQLEAAKGTHQQEPSELKASIDTVRKAIAEEYYQKGMKTYRNNLAEAIADWERSVQYDPAHPQAAARLQRARQMQQNLKAIESSEQ